jgi:hypothetical protein
VTYLYSTSGYSLTERNCWGKEDEETIPLGEEMISEWFVPEVHVAEEDRRILKSNLRMSVKA